MKKTILNLSLILAITGSVGIAEGAEFKECQSDQDKVSGCVERLYNYNYENLQHETIYKNKKCVNMIHW